MRSNPPSSTLIGIASCVASFLAGVAYADGFVRGSSRGPGIAVFTRSTDVQRIEFAPDGEHFDVVIEDPSLSIYDVVVLADGALLIAREAHNDRTQASAVKVTRVLGKDHREVTLPRSPMFSDAHFTSNGDHVVLANAGGAFRSEDGGRSWTRAGAWKADGYAFYAASLWLDDAGAIDVLAPVFNTCGSSDLLEDLTRLKLDPSGVASRSRLSYDKLDGPWSAAVGRHGFLYSTSHFPDGCALRVHARGETKTIDPGGADFGGPCYVTSQDNGRFNVLQFGSRLFRANGASVTYLGDGGEEILDAYPDNRGRALVLHRDGRVVRHGSKAEPVLVKAARP